MAAFESAEATRFTAAQRRAQLAEVAARRFEELGFHRVTLADVAADAGVTGPAVYRHFRNKQGLLAGAISAGLDAVEEVLAQTAGEPLEDLVSAMAELLLNREYLWPLLQREIRFLVPELRSQVQEQFDAVVGGFVASATSSRPRRTSWAPRSNRRWTRLLAERERSAGNDRLDGLVGRYVDFCLRNRTLVAVYISDMLSLPQPSQ